MKGIFISYRREDTAGFARSLFQSLEKHFGADRVFMDVEGIELGVDFVEALDKSLAGCCVLLVLIGKEWASCTDESGARRLENPDDFVRMEVASALQRSDVRVIPVLVRGAMMPRGDELPEDLQSLTRRQALELRHDRWNADVQVLIEAVEKLVGAPAARQAAPTPKPAVAPPPSVSAKAGSLITKVLAIAGGLFVVLIVLTVVFYQEEPSIPEPPPVFESTEPSPGPAAPEPAGTTTVLVFSAQELLAELGYEPGPVDGVMGAQTKQAIRSFQRDHGIPADGRATHELIDAMQQAVASRIAPQPATTPRAATSVNVSGIWIDDDGIRYNVVQQGTSVQFEAYDTYGSLIGGGEGRLSGRQFEYAFITLDGMQYTGRSTISADNRRMDYQSMNLVTGEHESGSLRRQSSGGIR